MKTVPIAQSEVSMTPTIAHYPNVNVRFTGFHLHRLDGLTFPPVSDCGVLSRTSDE